MPQVQIDLILNLRKENPTYGKAKIAVIIKRDHGLCISESSVGRLLKRLVETGKIKRSNPAWTKKKKRNFIHHAKRWEKYNGGVERCNRILRDEFYARNDLLANSIGAMKFALKLAIQKYNSFRSHRAVDFLTPFEYLRNLSEVSSQSNIY
jgi:transposase InsO family protein